MRRHPLAQMITIGVIASAVGIALALAIDWFPSQASEQADDVDTLFDVLLIASVPIFVLVEVVVLFSVWKFRVKPGEELKDGPPIHGNTRLEVVWTAIPAVILVGLCTYAYVVLRDIEEKQANPLRVNVTGEQFTWTFAYPGAGGKSVASTQLYLPKGRPVEFFIQSKDVIHSFWVPDFRLKRDAVPGTTQRIRLTPSKIGNYPVVCAELCGLGHSVMRQTARVVSPTAFDAWLAKQRGPGGAGGGAAGGGGAPDGKQVFAQAAEPACSSCHTLADAGATAALGPNLDETLKGKDAAYIRRAIVDPNASVAAGFGPNIMPPNYEDTLSPQELDALVEYLSKVAAK